MRRRLLPPEPLRTGNATASIAALARPAEPPAEPVVVNAVQLQAVLERLREQAETHVAQIQASLERTIRLAQDSSELRARCHQTRIGSRRAAI
jgi:hypothetical protein